MTFLFDIGNVLLAFDFPPALNSLKGPNHDPNAIEKIISAKDSFEAGETPLDEYIFVLRKLLDFHGSEADLFKAWNSIFTKIPETFQLARTLKMQGHRLILFSNINPIHAPYCVKKYNLLKHFDHSVFSYEIGVIKPENAFYTQAFEKYRIIPDKTIYIDDLPENIVAGKHHGLRSFCYNYRQHNDLLKWLDTQNIQ